jgi:hypothetical protein
MDLAEIRFKRSLLKERGAEVCRKICGAPPPRTEIGSGGGEWGSGGCVVFGMGGSG